MSAGPLFSPRQERQPLRAYQGRAVTSVVAGWDAGTQSICLVAPTGCHAPGQGILRADGSVVPVEDVRVGDLLQGPDGPRVVLQLRHGTGEMFRIVPVKGEPFIVNADHVLSLVRTREGHTSKKCNARANEIVDVTVRDWLKWSKRQKHIHKLFRVGVPEFSEATTDLPVPPYILGLLLGDGHLRRGVEFTTADQEPLDAIRAFAAARGLAVVRGADSGAATTWRITAPYRHATNGTFILGSNPVTAELRKLGVDCDSGRKFVPQMYRVSSRGDRLDLLAGLLDTDGSATNGGFDFISKSEHLARDVAFLARSLGLAAYVARCEKSAHALHRGTYFRVSISGECSIVPCRIPRKKVAARRQRKNVLRTGFRVERVGRGEFFGFTLDADGRYVLDDFTVTHNSGKTRMGEELVHHELERGGGGVLWLAHRRELLRQARDRLRASLGYLEVGAIAPGEPWVPAARVQVATVQTLLARDERPPASLLVFDEAHHYVSDEWRELARVYPQARAVGLTATPERGDGRPLGDIFGDLVVAAHYSELIAGGFLVPARIFEPGECIHDGLALDVVTAYQRYASGTRAFVFLRSVQDCKDQVILFQRSGWSAGVIEANTPAHERDELLARFRAGELKVLCSVATLTEGVDVPEAETCVLARTIGHPSTYLQMVGRVLRPAAGKTEATVLDLVGAWRLHGLPTDDRDYALDGGGGIRQKRATAVTQCLRCGAVSEAHVRLCPMCGWERPARELAPQVIYGQDLHEIAPEGGGRQAQVDPGEVYADLRARQRSEGQPIEWLVGEFRRRFGRRPDLADVTRSERRAEWERLRSVAAIASRKRGWVDQKYRDIFGELPDTTSLVTDRIAGRIAALGGSR